MSTHLFRRMSRRARLLSYVPLGWWTWTHREQIRRMLPLVKTAPQRVWAGETAELVAEARQTFAAVTPTIEEAPPSPALDESPLAFIGVRSVG